MTYIYDSHTLLRGEQPLAVARQWGRDGWRWVNPSMASATGDTMIFELAREYEEPPTEPHPAPRLRAKP